MTENISYNRTIEIQRQEKLRELLRDLPEFCHMFFISIQDETTILTRIQYAYDLRLFFRYMTLPENPLAGKSISEIKPEDIERVKADDILYYLDYLSMYDNSDTREGEPSPAPNIRTNGESGKMRKLASLRTFYHYLHKRGYIENDYSLLVDMPKRREKAIVRLEPDEIAKILDLAENGEGLTKKQLDYHKATRKRDLAILTLFLGTGIRISECIGININDIDFSTDSLRIIRKGQKEAIVYFWTEVEKALRDYMEERKQITPEKGHEDAFFLSMQRKRITARAVQQLVKKYAANAAPLKTITPHKLRSTFGTELYKRTDDLYVVADMLGHTDMNVTRRHYAAIADEHKREAAREVTLRED